MNKIWGALCIFFTVSSIQAQLVNIESIRMQTDSIRFVLKSDFLFNYSNNDGIYIYRFNVGLNTQYKTKNLKNTFFFSGNAVLVRSQDQDFQNSWFMHFRYNNKLTKKLRLEAFIQDQNNELLSINMRSLLGLGLRYKFVKGEYFQAYLGNSYMYEKERSDAADQTYYNHRNSTYLSLAMNLKESKLELLNTIYFQPLYADIRNFRLLEQFKAEMPVFKSLKVSMLFNYFFNNQNPFGASEFSSVLSVGLTYEIDKALAQ
jgi:hypothetical protein